MAVLDQRGLEEARAQAFAPVDGVSDAGRLPGRRRSFARLRAAACR
jgi:hypothetical protein